MGTTAAVLGATGYAGAELLRLLVAHGDLDILAVAGERSVGQDADHVLPHLAGLGLPPVVSVSQAAASGADVCFSCLPSGVLEHASVRSRVVVDLADTNRAGARWVYGLTEYARRALPGAERVANPGCYPTAALLCLLPFAQVGLVTGPIAIDALSGFSGAGRRAEDHLSFATASGGAAAYGTTSHRHVPEIERGLHAFGHVDAVVSFTPHLVPMSRGILVTARAPLTRDMTDADALEVLRDAYVGEPFVSVVEEWPNTKAVIGTNRAHVSARVDARANLLVASAAIDNLGKGAAGQALQNANVALGFDELTALEGLGVWP